MNPELEQERIIEAALFASHEPIPIERLINLFDEDQKPSRKTVEQILENLQSYYAKRSLELKELASGFQFQVQTDLSKWIQRLQPKQTTKYSRVLLETLSIIAYRQPITRGEIEEIRGVQIHSSVIATLIDYDWIETVGHRNVPGRPLLYATTKHFLDHFGLKNLSELPPIGSCSSEDTDKNL